MIPIRSRTSSAKTKAVPKTPLLQRAASPQSKNWNFHGSFQRAKSTPRRTTSPATNSREKVGFKANPGKKGEMEIKASEDRIKNYQKEIAKVEKSTALEYERLKKEMQEMQNQIRESQNEGLQREIETLQRQRDQLKEEISQRNRNRNEVADITSEFEDLEAQLIKLQNDKIAYEEEIIRIMAINDVLLENMQESPKYASYMENARLRNEKRNLTEKLLRVSEDVCQQRNFRAKTSVQFLNNQKESNNNNELPNAMDLKRALQENQEAENQRQDLLNKIAKAKEQRNKELYEAFKNEAIQAYADIDASKNELAQLEQREKQLMAELAQLQASAKVDIPIQELQATKAQYRQAREEYINTQQEYHKNLVWELQLRIENETNQLRQNATNKINEMKAQQSKLKEHFLSLQNEYNKALVRDDDFVQINNSSLPIDEVRNEIDRVQNSFGQIGEEIQRAASEEAKKELELADQEFIEMQEISADINKWISDLHLSSLQSQSREEALRSQIDVLNRRTKHPNLNYEQEMSAILEKAQNESQKLNIQLDDSKRRLRELDVMLGAPDNDDVSLEQRFQSIQDRIAALLDDSDDTAMKLDRVEKDLREELAKLKKANK